MIAYVDSSVLLRVVLRDPDPLQQWNEITTAISSELMRAECHRTLDRLWHRGQLNDRSFLAKRQVVEKILGRFKFLPLNETVLSIAEEPLPVSLATLDALHLASALIERSTTELVFATHDKALARAAREMALQVVGT